MDNFNTPVIFMVYNRPKETSITINRIKYIKPKTLYIIADYPKNKEDEEKCFLVKNIIDKQIDWPCEIIKDYATEHLGPKYRPSTGISDAFKIFDHAVILEDDCVPDQSFFQFCEELLYYHKDNHDVMSICGYQPINISSEVLSNSYYFSQLMIVWGWATWKRAWNQYDVNMTDWPKSKEQQLIEKKLKRNTAIDYWIKHLDWTYSNELITWDFQWAYTILKNNGKCIVPKHNLISNIGFNQYATHTKNPKNPHSNRPTQSISFPIRHPDNTEIDTSLDYATQSIFKLGR